MRADPAHGDVPREGDQEVNVSRAVVLLLVTAAGVSFGPSPLQGAAPQESQQDQELYRSIDENRQSHLAFLQELIRAQSGGEEAVQAAVASRFESLGLQVETLRLEPTQLSPTLEFAADETIDRTERISVVGRLAGK